MTPSNEPTSTGPSAQVPQALAAALAGLPQRVRVHDLARRAGLNSKQAIAALAEAGVEVGSASSSIDREVAETVLTSLLGGGAGEPAADQQASDADQAAAAADADHAAAAADAAQRPRRRSRRGRGHTGADEQPATGDAHEQDTAATGGADSDSESESAEGESAGADGTDSAGTDSADEDGGRSRRRRRGGRGRRGSGKGQSRDHDADADTEGSDTDADGGGAHDSEAGNSETEDTSDEANDDTSTDDSATDDGKSSSSRRRRRRRRRSGSSDGSGDDDPADTVVHVRESRSGGSESVQGVKGSTRLEAKRQRRRDSRDSRRRPQILSEAEFLARRESVDRVMAVRQHGDLAQVALLEDGVLVEHFVSRSGAASMIGNVYLGRVQNVLPSMEAAFVDIGKGRNAVLYAGEVNWDIAGLEGKERRIETALSSGDTVLVQVSKDPIGHKGARLTTQISLPGRFLVYVPGGGATGISRKLPDVERKRLKAILDKIVPADAGVLIRTAAEGVGEDELAADVARLQAKWEEITRASEGTSGKAPSAPAQLYAEPDTLIKVIRDLFNSDINRLLIDGDDAWASVSDYVLSVAPELADRVSRYVGERDVFAAFRIDEQIAKALQRKVHLPSGGSLVIDRTEAMTVIDVNTGKFTGSGGNLEETVTRNNIEAAEEIVRQLRLRDIGGIIVVDFIDMVLESNRELVLRRLTECLGRDRTRHQVAEVTSLGLVQMTRKRMGLGLVEAFSEPCPHCGGRGILLHDTPADTGAIETDGAGGGDRARRKGRKRGKGGDHDETAKFEPLVVERVTADAKPNPLGPKPPALFRPTDGQDEVPAELGAGDSEATEPGTTEFETTQSRVGETEVTESAPAGDEESAAASVTGTAPEPAAAAPVSDTDGAPAEPAEPATARPPRRRRAASRPAGAPSATASAVDIVVTAPVADTETGTAVTGAGTDRSEPAPADGSDGAPAAKPRRRRAASRPAGPVTAPQPTA
jgi:ribonuclease E